MPNLLFENMSAAERRDLANKILDLPPDQQRELVNQLSGVIEAVSAAEAGLERKKTAIARISAARESLGGANALKLVDGHLHRGNLPSIDELAEIEPRKIMQLFAASSMDTLHKMECKNLLAKLKIIP
jgi:hypothetical protein